MSAADLLERIEADGLTLRLAAGDEIKVTGKDETIARWLPMLKERKAEVIETLKVATTFTDWRVCFDQASKWVVFPNGATRAEVEALYPAAVRVEPIERPPNRGATEAERKELWERITVAMCGALEEVGEARAAALMDVESALICYRSLTEKSERACPQDGVNAAHSEPLRDGKGRDPAVGRALLGNGGRD